MRRIVRSISESLIRSFLPAYAAFVSIVFFMSLYVAVQMRVLFGITLLIAAFFLFELVFRFLLFIAYGASYRYAIFTYLLIDDAQYGTILRRGTDAKKLPFSLFDIFAFPIGSGRITDAEENHLKRNEFSINSLGFRGKEFDPNQKTAKVRIFCMGGSTTAGHCINDSETYPVHLEKVLQKNGYDVEVINAGAHGWYSYKDFLRYKNEIANYHADIVLLHEGWNEEFLWSCLSLGKTWQPRMTRNVREEHMLYSPPSRFLSSDRFFSKFLLIQALRKKYIFKRNMNFQNADRWRGLERREYIRAWAENMLDIARVAKVKNALVYTIDYPSLVSMDDSMEDREVYIHNSRLTPLYAEYQAASKARIEETLTLCSKAIPRIPVIDGLRQYKGMSRLSLFLDEIHLSGVGNELLAKSIAGGLIADPAFQARYRGELMKSNVHTEEAAVEQIMERAGKNSYEVERFIAKKIDAIEGRKVDTTDIPTERYTTF